MVETLYRFWRASSIAIALVAAAVFAVSAQVTAPPVSTFTSVSDSTAARPHVLVIQPDGDVPQTAGVSQQVCKKAVELVAELGLTGQKIAAACITMGDNGRFVVVRSHGFALRNGLPVPNN